MVPKRITCNDFNLQTVKGFSQIFFVLLLKDKLWQWFENIIGYSLLELSVRETKMEVRIRCDWKVWFSVCLKAKIGDWDTIPFPDIKGIENCISQSYFKVLHSILSKTLLDSFLTYILQVFNRIVSLLFLATVPEHYLIFLARFFFSL